MGVIQHRGQITASKRWPDGKRFLRVGQSRTEAKELLKKIEGAIVNGTWRDFREELQLRNRNKITLAEFADTYIEQYAKARNKENSWKRKETSLNALKPILGQLELDAITPAHLHRYVKRRKKQNRSEATINREITCLKHILTYAVECGIIKVNPVERFKSLREESRERPRFTDGQIDAVIENVKPLYRPLFIFIRETGCRREEACALQHWQIQKEQRMVVFSHDTKSRRYRYVPLTEAALAAIEVLPRLEECPFVFYNPETKSRWYDCKKPWEEARSAAGVKNLLVKDLRRMYAIKLAENGASMHDIQQVLGHASVATTEKHYAQFSPEHSSRRVLPVLEGGADTKRIHRSKDAKPSPREVAASA